MPTDQSTAPRFVPDAVTLALYRTMLTVFYVEERMKIFVRQGKCPFHASTRGLEELQVAMAMLLAPGVIGSSATTGPKRSRSVSGCR
jgi:TPP-dependent pyruvate/acetoin dehydrogenase alpha subunit